MFTPDGFSLPMSVEGLDWADPVFAIGCQEDFSPAFRLFATTPRLEDVPGDLLRSIGEGESDEIRLLAARAGFHRLRGRNLTEGLAYRLSTAAEAEARMLTWAIGRLDGSGALVSRALHEALDREDEKLRTLALWGISRANPTEPYACRRIVGCVERESGRTCVQAVISHLRVCGEAEAVWRRARSLVEGRDLSDRYCILRGVLENRPPEADGAIDVIRAAVDAARDEGVGFEYNVRGLLAIECLKVLGMGLPEHPLRADCLTLILASLPHKDGLIQFAALGAIESIGVGEPRVIEALEELAERLDGDNEFRRAVLRVLSGLR